MIRSEKLRKIFFFLEAIRFDRTMLASLCFFLALSFSPSVVWLFLIDFNGVVGGDGNSRTVLLCFCTYLVDRYQLES